MPAKLSAQIALWDDGLTVALNVAALEWLDAQGTDRHISVITEGLTVLVCPDTESDSSVRRRVSNKGPGSHCDYRHGATFSWDAVQGFDLPRFALYEVQLHPGNGGYYFYATLPAPHLLPWPKLRDCASYDVPTQLATDLKMRMRSARDASLGLPPSKWHMEPMPEKFRKRLGHEAYAKCLRAVIEEAEALV